MFNKSHVTTYRVPRSSPSLGGKRDERFGTRDLTLSQVDILPRGQRLNVSIIYPTVV